MPDRRLQDGEAFRERAEGVAERPREPFREADEQAVAEGEGAVRVDVKGPENGEQERHPRAREDTAELEEAEERALDLLLRGRQHKEIEAEQHEDGDQVDHPLEDDRGEPRRRADGIPARDEVGPDDLTGPGNEKARGEADHGGGEEVGIPDLPERGQQVPPAPGTEGVDHGGHQHDAQTGSPAGPFGGRLRARPSPCPGRRRRAGEWRAPPRWPAGPACELKPTPLFSQSPFFQELDSEVGLYYNAPASAIQPSLRAPEPGFLNPDAPARVPYW